MLIPKNKLININLYVDGSCYVKNRLDKTRHIGCGVRVLNTDNGEIKELSVYLGTGTINEAELRAIEIGLRSFLPEDRVRFNVTVYSDSQYAIGCLCQNYNYKSNVEIIVRIKTLMIRFNSVNFVKIKSHCEVKSTHHIHHDAADLLASKGASNVYTDFEKNIRV